MGPQGFIGIHKGYLVNYRFIQRIDAAEVMLQDGTVLALLAIETPVWVCIFYPSRLPGAGRPSWKVQGKSTRNLKKINYAPALE